MNDYEPMQPPRIDVAGLGNSLTLGSGTFEQYSRYSSH
jgi:hypothetical protein